MITKQQYDYWKPLVDEYEAFERQAKTYTGTSTCPFCGGCGVTPFLRLHASQDCTECNTTGQIPNRRLFELDLSEEIEK